MCRLNTTSHTKNDWNRVLSFENIWNKPSKCNLRHNVTSDTLMICTLCSVQLWYHCQDSFINIFCIVIDILVQCGTCNNDILWHIISLFEMPDLILKPWFVTRHLSRLSTQEDVKVVFNNQLLCVITTLGTFYCSYTITYAYINTFHKHKF